MDPHRQISVYVYAEIVDRLHWSDHAARETGYRPSRVNIMAQGRLSTSDCTTLFHKKNVSFFAQLLQKLTNMSEFLVGQFILENVH